MSVQATSLVPQVRESQESDLPAVQAIYAHHVRHGRGSFELEPPDLAEMTARRRAVVERHLPYLIAELEGSVGGYAYAGPYRPRPAYRFSLEVSVYVSPERQRLGLGRLLLGSLIERCEALGYRQLVAVIGDSGNHPSIALHESLGFRHVGTLSSVGWKHGRWLDTVLLQRGLGRADTAPPDG